jgi:hypothetical protein
MKRSFFTLLILSQVALGQGWQQLGPDSLNWREAYHLTGRWLSDSSFHLAASTSAGIAVYSSLGTWDYTLRHIPESIFNNGISYALLEFSPWEPDSCFVGHYIAYTEADLHITKTAFPPAYPPVGGGARGPCWGGPLSVAIPPNNDSVVFAGVCGIQRSSDRGLTWDTLSFEGLIAESRLIGVDESNSQAVFRAAESWSRPNGVLYRSTDSGASWDSLFSGLPRSTYYSFASQVVAQGDTILLGMRSYPSDTSSAGSIVRSIDGGTTWSQTFNQGRVLGLANRSSMPGDIYAAASLGILHSADWGLTWTPFNNALPTPNLTGLVLDPYSDTIYVSTTTHGVLKTWRFTTDVHGDGALRPRTVAVLQNYPNPFNPLTKIAFDLPERSQAMLVIFDMLGREVARLVDEVREPGRHEVLFDGSGLASGVYYYRLSAGNIIQARKMILQR